MGVSLGMSLRLSWLKSFKMTAPVTKQVRLHCSKYRACHEIQFCLWCASKTSTGPWRQIDLRRFRQTSSSPKRADCTTKSNKNELAQMPCTHLPSKTPPNDCAPETKITMAVHRLNEFSASKFMTMLRFAGIRMARQLCRTRTRKRPHRQVSTPQTPLTGILRYAVGKTASLKTGTWLVVDRLALVIVSLYLSDGSVVCVCVFVSCALLLEAI